LKVRVIRPSSGHRKKNGWDVKPYISQSWEELAKVLM